MALKRNINYPAASNYKPIIRRDILQDDPIAAWSEATRQSRDINIFEGIESFYGVILGGRLVAAEGTILAALHHDDADDENAVNNMSQFEYQVGIFNGDGTGLTDWMENPLDMTEGSLKQQFFTSLIDYIPMILSTGINEKKLNKGSIVKVKYTNSNFTDGIIVEIVKKKTETEGQAGAPLGAKTAVNNRDSAPTGALSNMECLPQGVSANPGVKLGTVQIAFLDALRQETDAPLYVTSGTRTVDEQAAAMRDKYDSGGIKEIEKVYKKTVADAVEARTDDTLASWSAVVRYLINIKRFSIETGHLGADAIDLRSNNLTPDQIKEIVDAANELGAKGFEEGNPPHIHIEKLSTALKSLGVKPSDSCDDANNNGIPKNNEALVGAGFGGYTLE